MPSKNSLTAQMELDSKDSMTKEEDFFDNIHELKNRLTVIYGGSQLVALQLKQALEKSDILKYVIPDDFLENLEFVCEEVEKIKGIIDNLDYTYRLDRNKEPNK